jgi:hypothetical protein
VHIICGRRKTCGSWLASDGGLSFSIDVEAAGLIASKLAPTGLGLFEWIVVDVNTVGAGLPAMAVCQSASMLNLPASSRASLLLQVCVVRMVCGRRKNCRSWLASDGGLSVSIEVGGAGLIASKLAPTGLGLFEWIVNTPRTSPNDYFLSVIACVSRPTIRHRVSAEQI